MLSKICPTVADQERLQTVQLEASISACVVIITLLYEMHNSLNPNQSHNCCFAFSTEKSYVIISIKIDLVLPDVDM